MERWTGSQTGGDWGREGDIDSFRFRDNALGYIYIYIYVSSNIIYSTTAKRGSRFRPRGVTVWHLLAISYSWRKFLRTGAPCCIFTQEGERLTIVYRVRIMEHPCSSRNASLSLTILSRGGGLGTLRGRRLWTLIIIPRFRFRSVCISICIGDE